MSDSQEDSILEKEGSGFWFSIAILAFMGLLFAFGFGYYYFLV